MTLNKTVILGALGVALGAFMLMFAFATSSGRTHAQTPGTTTTSAAGTATTPSGTATTSTTRTSTASSGTPLTPSASAGSATASSGAGALPSTGTGSDGGGSSATMWLILGGMAIAATGAGVVAAGVRRR